MRFFIQLVLQAAVVITSTHLALAAPAKTTTTSQRSLKLNEQGVEALKTKNPKLAESLFRQAVDTDRYNVTAVFNLAGMLITNKKEREAITLLSSYTHKDSKDAGLFARLGDAYFGTQEPKNAIINYEKALSLEPQYRGIPARLGTLYSLENKLDKAATMYKRAVAQNPTDAKSFANLSSLYLALGQPKEAVSTAKKALALTSTPEAYLTLGAAYQQLQDPQQALLAFRQALQLGSKDPALTKVITDLESSTRETT